MRAQVQVTYGAKYTDTEISALEIAIGQAVGDMTGAVCQIHIIKLFLW